jgi:hypothetical protein
MCFKEEQKYWCGSRADHMLQPGIVGLRCDIDLLQ